MQTTIYPSRPQLALQVTFQSSDEEQNFNL